MKAKVNRVTLQIVEGDLLSLSVAAVVNATTTDLALSPELIAQGGVELQRECARIGFVDVGTAVATGAGKTTFDKIIHTAGPRWGEGAERGKLMLCVLESLRLAEQHKLKSIAFPAISVGALGYPVENCAVTMLTQIIDYTFEDLKSLRAVVICLPDASSASIFKREFQRQIEELRETGDAKV
ncbi:MAG: macro domain-containing protein [bacterium]|nr:macro domain-containing protein [bacterium]